MAAGDPNWENVVLLAPMNSEGSPSEPLDKSQSAHTLTLVNDAAIDEGVAKFGNASLKMDGNGDYVSIPGNADFNILGAVTLEGWVNAAGGAGDDGILGRGDTGANERWQVYLNAAGTVSLFIPKTGATVLTSTTDIRGAGWVHWAITHDGTTWRLFLDGTQEDSKVEATFPDADPSEILYIGTDRVNLASRSLDGHIDDVRITQNVARYTANFTPPAVEFPDFAAASASGVAGQQSVVIVAGL